MKATKLKKIIEYMNELFPLSSAEEWDNSGIQLALSDEVHKVMSVLEITDSVVSEAISEDVDLIISHHPLFFSGVKSLSVDKAVDSFVIKLVQSNISVYSAHTSCDIACGGLNDYFGELIEVEDIQLLSENNAYCRCGRSKKPMKLIDFCNFLSNKLSVPKSLIRYVGDGEQIISNIAWCTGSGMEFATCAYNKDVDVYVTGDVKHHNAVDARQAGLNVIDIGHFGSEYIFSQLIKAKLSKDICVIESKNCYNPIKSI